jgi:hypothetical protein
MSRLSYAACLTVMLLAGCSEFYPPEHSPHYSYVSSDASRRPVLVPDACLTPDPTDTALGPHLPPGCANAYNLEQMAERQRDLVEGRRLGHAPGAPSARAAQRYLDGINRPLGGAVGTTPNTPGSSTTTSEPAGGPAQPPTPVVPSSPPIQARSN